VHGELPFLQSGIEAGAATLALLVTNERGDATTTQSRRQRVPGFLPGFPSVADDVSGRTTPERCDRTITFACISLYRLLIRLKIPFAIQSAAVGSAKES
jgi:hypothetical protein